MVEDQPTKDRADQALDAAGKALEQTGPGGKVAGQVLQNPLVKKTIRLVSVVLLLFALGLFGFVFSYIGVRFGNNTNFGGQPGTIYQPPTDETPETEEPPISSPPDQVPQSEIAKRIVENATKELGECERPNNSNDSPRIRDYKNGAKNSYPWCAYFVTFVLKESGVSIPTIGAAKSVMNHYQSNPSRFEWYDKRTAKPQPGDIFIRHRACNGSRTACGHIGIVVAYDEKTGVIHTIDGNASNCVKRRTIRITDSNLIGFGRVKTSS